MNINKNDFWSDNYYNHPPLTDELIKIAELTLKVQLPKLLVELLKIQNGGYTKGFVFPTQEKVSWASNHVPFNELFGIVAGKSIKTPHNILDTEYLTKEWSLPEKQVLLSGEGHWWISLDYRNGLNPTVNWIDLEANEDIQLANNFADFIYDLVSMEEYKKK